VDFNFLKGTEIKDNSLKVYDQYLWGPVDEHLFGDILGLFLAFLAVVILYDFRGDELLEGLVQGG